MCDFILLPHEDGTESIINKSSIMRVYKSKTGDVRIQYTNNYQNEGDLCNLDVTIPQIWELLK